MSWLQRSAKPRARKSFPYAMVELLEPRVVMADGIAALPAFPILTAPSAALDGVVVATYRGDGTTPTPPLSWRAQIDWGDGSAPDKKVEPRTQADGSFAITGSHTYASAGTYTITVRIAVPGSGKPDSNKVTTRTYVVAASSLTAQPKTLSATTVRPFNKAVATVIERGARARDLHATIEWGLGNDVATGRIVTLGRGKFAVLGRRKLIEAGSLPVVVTITDGQGLTSVALSKVVVRGPARR